MIPLRKFFSRRPACHATSMARQRLGRTMPGETAALAGNRLGVLVG